MQVTLFDRSHRQIELTKIGNQVYEDAQRLLKCYEEMCYHVEKNHLPSTVRMAMLPVFSQYAIAKEVQYFLRENKVKMQVIEIEERDLSQVMKEEMDLCMVRGKQEMLSSYARFSAGSDELIAIVAKNHPLAHRKEISLKELKREPLLLFPQYTEISKLTIKACLDNGFQPTIKRYGRMETLLYEVKEEGVVLAMKRSIQQYHLSDLKVIELKEKIISHRYLYIRKETMQKTMIKALVNHLIKQGFVMEDNN